MREGLGAVNGVERGAVGEDVADDGGGGQVEDFFVANTQKLCSGCLGIVVLCWRGGGGSGLKNRHAEIFLMGLWLFARGIRREAGE